MHTKPILVIDNYDSFVYNLVHYLRDLDAEVAVYRNDKINLDEVDQYDKILLSPGPGIPDEAGIMPALLQRYAPTKSILGVCLGHQAIGEAFGAQLHNLPEVLHGISSTLHVHTPDEVLFRGLPPQIRIGHYHSWVIDAATLTSDLELTASDTEGNIMAVRHRHYRVRGVQFHPESVLTEHGKQMLTNWLQLG